MAERTTDEFRADEGEPLGSADQGTGESDPAEIRAEIRETRERMGDTLEQLGDRLNPSHVKEQVKHEIRDATIGKVEHMAQNAADTVEQMAQNAAGRVDDARRTISDTIRENPIPAAMVGIGLGWLFLNARQQGSSSYTSSRSMGRGPTMPRGRYAAGYGRNEGNYAGGYGGGYASGYATGYAADQANAGYDTGYGYGGYGGYSGGQGSSDASSTIDQVRDKASELADDAKDTAGELADRAQRAAGDVADRAQQMAGTVADQTRYQARRVEDQFYENPLAIGGVALALGMAAGLAIPETQKESELMGSARDRFVTKVREVADETKDKVSHVVDQVQTTAKQAAQQEGLTSA